ncbi:hypothetical protein Tco_0612985 [Tanacetum coccineum]
MNMALVLMAKAFKLNYSTPTNNNQRISSNPRNRQIVQPGMNMGQDRKMQMVGGHCRNQFRQYAGQNVRNQNVYNAIQNVGNQITQLVIAQKEEAGIQLQAEDFDLMVAAGDHDEIKEVSANCILMANLQQASTSSTQTNKAPVYNSDGSDENDNNVISTVFGVEQSRGTVEQNPDIVEETRALYDSLYNNMAIEVKMDDPNITMEEYIRLEEEEARRRGKVYNWKTATYGKIWDDEDIHDLRSIEIEFLAIVLNNALTSEVKLSCEPTVSSLNDNEIEFRISFDESDDEDYMDFLTEPIVSTQHIDEFNLRDETSLSEYDEEEQNILYFNDLFLFNVIYLDDLKSDKDNDDDKINIKHSLGG